MSDREQKTMLRAETILKLRELACRAFDLEPSEQWLLRESPVEQKLLDGYAEAHWKPIDDERIRLTVQIASLEYEHRQQDAALAAAEAERDALAEAMASLPCVNDIDDSGEHGWIRCGEPYDGSITRCVYCTARDLARQRPSPAEAARAEAERLLAEAREALELADQALHHGGYQAEQSVRTLIRDLLARIKTDGQQGGAA